MRLRARLLAQIGLALSLACYFAPGYCAKAHMYRCVDTGGRVYYSDRPGNECEDGKHDRLTRGGLVLDRPAVETNKPPPDETPEERRERLARERYDRTLRATYTSEAQIEAAKQRSLKSPILAVKWSKQRIDTYRERLAELEQRAATLIENDEPVPDSLNEDILTAQDDVTRLERELSSKQSRVDRIVSRFEADKKRYRELNGSLKNN